MDRSLLGLLLLGVAFLPWVAEVFWQVRLQPRVLEALPDGARAALPPHPRRAALAFVSSARFQLAFWRLARRDSPEDADDVRALKRQVRASLRREIAWIVIGVGVLGALLATGWRPDL
ncbi:MAG TPA: hypothetical protein VHJ20_20750 [Polyangia bacterium]|nr:hypothetical protein [Polyangia bacterium]